MVTRNIILITFVFILLFCCGTGKKTQTEIITFDSVFDPRFNPVKILGFTLSHKRISIEGFLSLKSITALRSDNINLYLFEKTENRGRFITTTIPFGYNQNQIEKPPRHYKEEDLKVHTSDNEIIGIKQKVRITGKRYCHKGIEACYILVDTIEKAP
jgi:hypothetical protein